jgi:hypothetical protein
MRRLPRSQGPGRLVSGTGRPAGWDAPGCGGGLLTAEIDAIRMTAQSQNERAAPTSEKGAFDLLTVPVDHCAERNGDAGVEHRRCASLLWS